MPLQLRSAHRKLVQLGVCVRRRRPQDFCVASAQAVRSQRRCLTWSAWQSVAAGGSTQTAATMPVAWHTCEEVDPCPVSGEKKFRVGFTDGAKREMLLSVFLALVKGKAPAEWGTIVR